MAKLKRPKRRYWNAVRQSDRLMRHVQDLENELSEATSRMWVQTSLEDRLAREIQLEQTKRKLMAEEVETRVHIRTATLQAKVNRLQGQLWLALTKKVA